MSETNLQVRLAARPVGLPRESDFEIIERPIPEPADGEVLLRAVVVRKLLALGSRRVVGVGVSVDEPLALAVELDRAAACERRDAAEREADAEGRAADDHKRTAESRLLEAAIACRWGS